MPKFKIEKDPRLYQPKKPKPDFKRCLGLDLGTNCGVAIADFIPGQPVRKVKLILGQWDLSVGQYDTGPLRHIRLKQFLAIAGPDLVTFEDVKYTPSGEQMAQRGYGSINAIVARAATASELLGGFKITLTTWCEEHGIPAQGIGIGQIKKHATGSGVADKLAMIKACNEKFGTDFNLEDDAYKSEGTDNIADAAFACEMGVLAYSDGL